MSQIEDFLTKKEEEQIVNAIQEAELATSGEIRVHIEKKLEIECIERATEVFYILKMENTKDKNGVLFYVAVADHKFAIIGDKGIDEVVPDNFWESVKNNVVSEFAKGNQAKGLIDGILEAGIKLKEYFPYQKDDLNELPDEISKG